MKKNIRLLYILYAISIIVIVVISSLIYSQFSSLTDYSNRVERTGQLINKLETLKLTLVMAENDQLDYMLTKDSLLEPPYKVVKRINHLMDTIQAQIGKSEEQYGSFLKMKSAIDSRMLAMNTVWESSQTVNTIDYDKYLLNRQSTMQYFWKQANKIEELERETLKESSAQKKYYASVAPLYLYLIFGITCIFQVISFAFILKESKARHNYQQQLEEKIKDLNVTNAELEQIAFVASHDLQEPLRKIQTFSDRLLNKHSHQVDESGKQILDRINVSSQRLQELMADLVNYTSILHSDIEEKRVDLNECLANVKSSFKATIALHKANITTDELPVITGQYKQLYLLFYNLVDNALKFRKPGTPPIINVTYELAKEEDPALPEDQIIGYHKISVSDNGIGFDADFAHKIFIIFQRLHTQNSHYPGKGIGLAISKRVMMNHKGFITATGETGTGATFHLYFPQEDNLSV